MTVSNAWWRGDELHLPARSPATAAWNGLGVCRGRVVSPDLWHGLLGFRKQFLTDV
jgi:hypothetical protein